MLDRKLTWRTSVDNEAGSDGDDDEGDYSSYNMVGPLEVEVEVVEVVVIMIRRIYQSWCYSSRKFTDDDWLIY